MSKISRFKFTEAIVNQGEETLTLHSNYGTNIINIDLSEDDEADGTFEMQGNSFAYEMTGTDGFWTLSLFDTDVRCIVQQSEVNLSNLISHA